MHSRAGAGDAVISVDESREWLGKTARFIEGHGASMPHQLGGLDLLQRLPLLDVAFLDLNYPDERRARWVAPILHALRPGGLGFFDDTHQRWFRRALSTQCRISRTRLYSLRRYTADGFGRWASLGVKASR